MRMHVASRFRRAFIVFVGVLLCVGVGSAATVRVATTSGSTEDNVYLANTSFTGGQSNTLSIMITAQGDEAGVGLKSLFRPDTAHLYSHTIR